MSMLRKKSLLQSNSCLYHTAEMIHKSCNEPKAFKWSITKMPVTLATELIHIVNANPHKEPVCY